MTTTAVIRLPKTGKPSKCVSKDETRSVLLDAHLRKLDDWTYQVEATDGYVAVRVPVEVEGRPEEGPIPIKALIDWEKSETTVDGREIGATDGVFTLPRVTYDRCMPLDPEVSSFPRPNELWPSGKPARPLRLSINVKLLKALADALGQDAVTLTLDMDAVTDDGNYARTIPVEAMHESIEASGLIMPIGPLASIESDD